MRYSERKLYDDVVYALYEIKQDAQLSQRDRAAECVIVFAKSRTLGCAGKTVRSLRTRAIPERLRGAFTKRRYTNPRLPLPLPLPY